jgi:hypothetical protein
MTESRKFDACPLFFDGLRKGLVVYRRYLTACRNRLLVQAVIKKSTLFLSPHTDPLLALALGLNRESSMPVLDYYS